MKHRLPLHYRLQLDSAACEGNHGPYNNASQGGAVKKPFLALSLIVVLVWPAAIPSTHAKESQAPALLPIEQMRAVAYTKEFAKRFALPDPEPGTEPSGGIQAMEFAVEPGAKHSFGYNCKLKLYVDSGLSIAYPEEGIAGAESMLIQSIHFFLWPDPDNKRWLRLSKKDRRHFSDRKSRYWERARWATPGYRYQEQGASMSIFFEEYHRELFPDISYIKLDTTCPAYSWVEKVSSIQLWIERQGGKDYTLVTRVESDDFHKFSVPNHLWIQIRPWMKAAAEYNKVLIEQNNKRQRALKRKPDNAIKSTDDK